MTLLDLEKLLTELRLRGWTLYLFGDPDAPTTYGAVCRWSAAVDVLILWNEDDALAYRAPADSETDPFSVEWVNWVYGGNALWTLRAVLTLAPPGDQDAPRQLMSAPAACRLDLGKPSRVRPLGR